MFLTDREQWKVDLRSVHAKQQTQLQAIAQEQETGVHNRQRVDNILGAALVHPPGSNGGRSMAVDAINARVVSQSGRVIARERQTGVIDQIQQPARVPAAIAPEIVMNNIQRGQRIEDDPFIAAFLRVGESVSSAGATAAAAPPATNFKVQQEARSVEIQNLIQQYSFIDKLGEDYPNKAAVLKDIADRIVGTNDVTVVCPICREGFTGLTFVATLPCCNQRIHTNCLLQLSQQSRVQTRNGVNGIPCPMCRTDLCSYFI
jgi:hypothetical protein